MDRYDIAEICFNGHVTTSMAESFPQFRKQFCEECGEKTITNCPNCNSPIKGYCHIEDVVVMSDYAIPKFCNNCGQPYPWTLKQSAAAKELIEISDDLTQVEKDDFKNSIDDLVKNSPNTIVAQAKYKKYIGKAGTEIAKGLRDILVDVVSETVSKAIYGK